MLLGQDNGNRQAKAQAGEHFLLEDRVKHCAENDGQTEKCDSEASHNNTINVR